MRDKKQVFIVFALLASLAAVLTYNYFTFVQLKYLSSRLELHQSILKGKAPSPYRFRILVPLMVESLANLLSDLRVMSYSRAWIFSYLVYNFTVTTSFLLILYIFLRNWHIPLLSLVGTIFCGGLLPVCLRDHYFQPWSILEAFFFCAALHAAYRKRFPVIFLITVFASLNRVTGIFIPFIYLLAGPRETGTSEGIRKTLPKFILLLAASACIAVALRQMQGGAEHILSLGQLWKINTSPAGLILALLHWILFAGAAWLFAIGGFPLADEFTRRESLLIPLYLLPVAVFGVWKEVRLLMPLYPLIVSLALFYIEQHFVSKAATLPPDKTETRA